MKNTAFSNKIAIFFIHKENVAKSLYFSDLSHIPLIETNNFSGNTSPQKREGNENAREFF